MSKRAAKRRRAAAARAGEAAFSPLSPPNPAPAWIWYLAAGIAAVALGGFTVMLNTDLWFHLAAGRLILEERAVPRTDPWSFTAEGRPWHNHEWLSDVLFQAWAEAFGVDGLVWLHWLLIAATFLLLFRLLSRLSGSFPWSFLLTALAVATAAPFFDTRPQLFSFLLYAVLLQQLLLRPVPSLALPLLFALWINLHGGAIFGLMALTLGLATSALFSKDRPRLPILGGLWAACVLACLANPFGMGALTYPFELALAPASPSRTMLAEWLPPFAPGGIRSPLYPLTLVLFAAGALALPFRERRRDAWLSLALGGLTLAMSLQSRRFIVLFAISHTLVLALAGARLLDRGPLRRLAVRRRVQIAAALIALAAGLARLAAQPLTFRVFPLLTRMEAMPVETLSFAEANGLSGKVFAYFPWAGYVDYRSAGRLKVYIDPRSETVFDPATQIRYARVHTMQPGWEAVLNGSGAEYVLWPFSEEPYSSLVSRLLESGRWRLLGQDATSVLLVRSDLRAPATFQETPPSAFRSLARAYRAISRNDLASAEVSLEEALERMPELPVSCVTLVRVRRALGKEDEARGTAERCRRIVLEPEPREALRELMGET